MYAQVEKTKENKSRAVANSDSQKQSSAASIFQFVDNRPDAAEQRKLRGVLESPKVQRLEGTHDEKNDNTSMKQHRAIQNEKASVQGRFYYGQKRLRKGKLKEKLHLTIGAYIDKAQIDQLADKLWGEFGGEHDPDMEMGAVVKIIKNLGGNWGKGGLKRVVNDIKSVDRRDVNTPNSFSDRISNDTRLTDKMRTKYITAFNNQMIDPGEYDAVKTEVKKMRADLVATNIGESDNELKSGAYFKNEQKKKDFRDMKIESKLSGDAAKIMSRVEKRVLGMKDKLVAAWYYNVKNENDIFKDHELRSYTARAKAAGGSVGSKSMSEDLDTNKTGGYFYSFIEHEDSDFNSNTRFTKEATADGVLGSSSAGNDGRRVRIPARKLAKSGAIMMGGDLLADRQETVKMGLSQNMTPNKLLGSGGEKDKLEGLLRNYVKFVSRRIYEAHPYAISMVNPFRSYTEGEKVIQKLKEDLDSMTDKQLWEYLVRQIAQPQLMTPLKVATSIKNLKQDKP